MNHSLCGDELGNWLFYYLQKKNKQERNYVVNAFIALEVIFKPVPQQ